MEVEWIRLAQDRTAFGLFWTLYSTFDSKEFAECIDYLFSRYLYEEICSRDL
jgi:hypothetical protein